MGKLTISVGFIGFILLIPVLIAGWTEKSLEFWLTMLKGEQVDVPYILAFALTLVTNVFGLAFNIITELVKLAI